MARVGPFPGEVESSGLSVEAGAPRGQLADPRGAFLDQDLGGRGGDDPGAGTERVLEVEGNVVVGGHRHGHPSLGIAGVALGGLVLGDDQDAPVPSQLEGGPEARDPRTQHQEVRFQPRLSQVLGPMLKPRILSTNNA